MQTPLVNSVGVELARRSFRSGRAAFKIGAASLIVGEGGAYLSIPHGAAKIFLLVAPALGGDIKLESKREAGAILVTSVGFFSTEVAEPSEGVFHISSALTPAQDFKYPETPRDLVPLSDSGEPMEINPYATQRGLNSGIIYGGAEDVGTLLYYQNFTDTQDYFRQTQTTPDNTVGGHGIELGYQPPTKETNPLPAGKPTLIYSTWIATGEYVGTDARPLCKQFLNLFGRIYRAMEKPPIEYHPWNERAKKTLQHLVRSKDASRHDYGQLFLRPYLGAEVPDSMTQMSIIASLVDYGIWRKRPVALADRLAAGMRRFYKPDWGTVHRYLPNVSSDKNANEVDSWYLYHPLKNLAHCAKNGLTWAQELFRESLDYGIRAAHTFEYNWPIKYDGRDFSVIEKSRGDQGLGQTDVGGIYAYVMLHAYELYNDTKYLEEAKSAIQALSHHAFDLMYQSNLSALGAVACVRLAKITGDAAYRDQAGSFVATLLHNSIVWESQLNLAERYSTFFGISTLHDGPYMAAYECFECFGALRNVVAEGAGIISEDVALFAGESSRYAIDRSWSFYPDQLPEDGLATDIRNGYIDRNLSFPLEDLYADGRQAGEVGQEIYGAGAPFIFCVHAYKRLAAGGSLIYCDMPYELKEDGERLSLEIHGHAESPAEIRAFNRDGSQRKIRVAGGRSSRVHTVGAGSEYEIELG